MRNEQAFMAKCQLCGCAFQFGPHAYRGKVIAAYKLTLCDPCYGGNWDGYAPHYDSVLEGHWAKEGIEPPKRNGQGLYPRGG